ncbi:Retrotransposable element Tf2 155 kDa protein type 3 [Rhizoctonia solani AG-1 IB]|nr:Retrotransposable element Tf2 155 kDa protein type 3 [Rhizoctonia solani AG-1 IB]
MLLDSVFANMATVLPEKEIQRQIEASLHLDKSLDKILAHLEDESEAPPLVKRGFKDYKMEAGLLFYQGKLLVPDIGTLCKDLLQIFHNSPLAGHPGQQQTLELLSQSYYWPGIRADVYIHVDSCKTCQRIKLPKAKLILSQPLEIPTRPWQHISYDFITDLPKDGLNNCMLMIVDSFTKYGLMIACSKKIKAPGLVELFLCFVWLAYGMPEKTLSDCGTVFNNKILKALYQRLGIDLHFLLAYHPQSNGQTEQLKPTLEHFLQAYASVNQINWVKWLSVAQFAYNNAIHSSTGKSPFKALYGWEPTLTPSKVPVNVPKAEDLANTMEQQWVEIASALQQSKEQMTQGKPMEVPIIFDVGELAWMDARNINLKTKSPKLTDQWLGPFKITKKKSDTMYCLGLPETMRVPNVFYGGLLSKVKKDKTCKWENRPPPITVDGEEEYIVEGIMDSRRHKKGKWEYLVKWKGYGPE